MSAPMTSLIEGYLDGSLSADDRALFEARLERDPALRSELELQTRIDGSLGRLFEYRGHSAPAVPPESTSKSFKIRVWVPIAAAAAIVLIGVVVWLARPAPQPQYKIPRPQPVAFGLRNHYRAEVHNGFVPMAVCTTPEAFEAWVQQNYGTPLRPTETPEGVQFVGWNYTNLISSYTGILLARVDGQPVIVAMDKAELQTQPPTEGSGTEHIFSKEVDGLVLYEVTPFEEPRILPLLAVAKK
jgi:hypothetical protein